MNTLGFLSILPIIAAIGLAILLKEVALALFVAIFLAGFILSGTFTGMMHLVMEDWLIDTLKDADHIKVLLFSLFIGGTVGILSKSKTSNAFVNSLKTFAKSKKSGQLTIWFSGLIVFFDDYANCLIVGNSMRSFADKLKISRAKLAYIVDSTAAPIASISIISTWIAFQVGLIDTTFKKMGVSLNAYEFFIEGIFYNFYAIFTLFFVFLIAYTGIDFGPMREAEILAAKQDPNLPQDNKTEDAIKTRKTDILIFLLPIITLVLVTIGYLYFDGLANLEGQTNPALFNIIGNADSYSAILYGSFAALSMALILALIFKKLNLRETTTGIFDGFRELLEASSILILAWCLSNALSDLGASAYLVQILQSSVSAWALPTLVFILSALVAFSTGTSFGTIALMIPVTLPLAIALTDSYSIHLAVSSAVLGGAVLGDHSSPISDTTIMASMGTGCDHIEHVKTQLPYALFVGLICVIFGTLPVGFGAPIWLCLLSGLFACFVGLYLIRLRLNKGSVHLPRFVS